MPHPMKSQAHASSRDKFQAITGHRGGGHAHGGSSHLKKAGKDGVLETWSGHHKKHRKAEERAHGGCIKARADRRRGGRAEGGKKESKIDISKLDPSPGKYTKNPQTGSETTMNVGEGWYNRLSRAAGKKDKGSMSGFSKQDLEGTMKHGGKKRKAGGRALGGVKNPDWDEEDTPGGPLGGANARREIAAGNKPSSLSPGRKHSPPQYEDWGVHPASGRKKYARGGKAPGKVIINVNAAQPKQALARPPAMPPPAPPPAGPPPGGAPPTPPPGGGAGAPPGANPLAAIKGGMGFARGGRAKGQHPNPAGGPHGGDAKYDLAGWRKYAATDREKRMSGKAGMTQAYTKRIGDDGSLDVQPVKPGRRASGGRMTAGALSGEGRLEKVAISAKDRHR